MASPYMLPDGTHTTDDQLYGEAWTAFGARVVAHFPGYRVCGTGANHEVIMEKITDHAGERIGSNFRVPLAACRALLGA